MARELSILATLSFSKNGAKVDASSASLLNAGTFDVAGKYYAKVPLTVDHAGTTLDKGSIGTIGMVMLENLATAGIPTAPVLELATAGTPGSTSRTYVVVANFADGSIAVSDPVVIATSHATLDGTNYVIATWNDVGAATYDLYRTVSGGTPSTTGLIDAGSTSPHNDQGDAGDSSSVPAAVDSDFAFEYCSDGSAWDYKAKAGEPALFRFNQTDIHVRAAGPPVEIEPTLIED